MAGSRCHRSCQPPNPAIKAATASKPGTADPIECRLPMTFLLESRAPVQLRSARLARVSVHASFPALAGCLPGVHGRSHSCAGFWRSCCQLGERCGTVCASQMVSTLSTFCAGCSHLSTMWTMHAHHMAWQSPVEYLLMPPGCWARVQYLPASSLQPHACKPVQCRVYVEI